MFKDQSFSRRPRPAKVFFFVLAAILFLALMGGLVMYLWNAILPEVLGVKRITFWQAVGILALAKILFGFPPFRKGGKHHRSKARWSEKWMGMTDEEKQQLKEKWQERCSRRRPQ